MHHAMWQMLKPMALMFAGLGVSLVVGCGSGTATAKVSGKVAYNGQPVTAGTLMFLPIAKEGDKESGEPGVAAVSESGTFTVTSAANQSGTIIGKHRVVYNPPGPPPKAAGDTSSVEKMPYDNLVPKNSEIEVKPGANDIEIELVPATPGSGSGR